jgi:hypothetical protein
MVAAQIHRMTESELVERHVNACEEFDRRARLLSLLGAPVHPITEDVLRRMPADVRRRADRVFARRAALRATA